MDHLEMVEKLREKANVTYEEARDALEACDWDLLDALLLLESSGRLNEMEEAAYSTREQKTEEKPEAKTRKTRENGLIATLLHGLGTLIKKGNAVSFQIKKNGETRLSLPLTVVVIALVFMFWWMLIAGVVAMIFGYRYAIEGLSIDGNVNKAMDKAGDFVDNVVHPDPVKVVREENKKSEEAPAEDAQAEEAKPEENRGADEE